MASYSFSGCDFKCLAYPYNNGDAVELTTLVTVSFSTVHGKSPARTLNRNYPAGYTNTLSEIRGTMIFNRHQDRPLKGLSQMERYKFLDNEKRHSDVDLKNVLGGELDPFDLELIAVTEAGEALIPGHNSELSIMRLYGVEIIGSGEVISVHNTLTEKTYSFVARGFKELEKYGGPPLLAPDKARAAAERNSSLGLLDTDYLDLNTEQVPLGRIV